MTGRPCRSSSDARATMAPRTAYWVSRTAWLTSWSVRDMEGLSRGGRAGCYQRGGPRPKPGRGVARRALLLRQLGAGQRQLLALRVRHLGEGEVELLEGLDDGRGHHEPGEPLLVGGDHVPGRVLRGGGPDGLLVGLHVALPVGPLPHVGRGELPVLVRLVEALEEAAPLLL